MLARPVVPILGLLLAAVCVLGLVLAGRSSFGRSGSETSAGTTATPAARPARPPIDDAAPAGIKTATFALG